MEDSTKEKDIHPLLIKAFTGAKPEWEKDNPLFIVKISNGYRSNETQQKLYNQGRTTKGPKVTNAKPGQSAHNKYPSMAIDVMMVNKETKKADWNEKLYRNFAPLMLKTKGITWGGNWTGGFVDLPHYEITDWINK